MSYLQLFTAAQQLFPKHINVTLTNAVSGAKIGTYKVPFEQLPAAFNKPTTLTIANQTWRVLQADPLTAEDFAASKKLSLQVVANELNHEQIHPYNVPTYPAGDFATTPEPLYNEFTIDIAKDDWLQYQFLPVPALNDIQEELASITNDMVANPLLGYPATHVRQQIAPLTLNIYIDDFCELVNSAYAGAVRFREEKLYIENGFALQSANYLYYGLLQNDHITHLCITAFDSVDDEFMQITTAWQLALVDWCGARVIMAGETEEQQPEA
jgi:hypothetical protein